MTIMLIIAVIIVLVVLLLAVLTTSKAYTYKHTIDNIDPVSHDVTSESELITNKKDSQD